MDLTKITVWKKTHHNKGNPIKVSVYYHFWITGKKEVLRIMADVQKNTNAFKIEQRWVPIEEGHYPSSTRQARFKLQKSVPITEKDYHMLVAMIFGEAV